MTLQGWIFLILGWSSIITLTVYCFYKVYKSIQKENQNNNI